MRGRSGPSDLRAHSMRPRGSEQDGANEARGTCRTEKEGRGKKTPSATQIRDLCTYLWLIVLCTINNEVDTRPVRRSVHRLESDERAEAGQAMEGRCRGNDELRLPHDPVLGDFPSFLSSPLPSAPPAAGGNTRARDGRTRERGLKTRTRELKLAGSLFLGHTRGYDATHPSATTPAQRLSRQRRP